mmetsp:Transcript_103973/g.179150  ORF Transcript_103973/g.179150 Transcript_103973/m.179150 type:complete len:95 (+) Transcript_103973:283-567(+)
MWPVKPSASQGLYSALKWDGGGGRMLRDKRGTHHFDQWLTHCSLWQLSPPPNFFVTYHMDTAFTYTPNRIAASCTLSRSGPHFGRAVSRSIMFS